MFELMIVLGIKSNSPSSVSLLLNALIQRPSTMMKPSSLDMSDQYNVIHTCSQLAVISMM